MFSPAGLRNNHLMPVVRCCDYNACSIDQNAFSLKRADVDSKSVAHTQRFNKKSGPMRASPATSKAVKSSRSLSWQTSSEE